MTVRLPSASRDAAVDAVVTRADAGPAAGRLRIFTGAQPASANDAATGTLLAEVVLADPAFDTSAVTGSATLVDPAPVAAVAAGTAGWARMLSSDLVTVVDYSVSGQGGGGDIVLDNPVLAVGQSVDVAAGGTVTMPAG